MRFRKGQAALIVTPVAVAVISRSVTDVGVSVQEEERARSFSAAEAGVEDALRQDLSLIAGSGTQSISLGESFTKYSVIKLTDVTARIDPGQVITIDWTKGSGTSANLSWSNSCARLVSTQITSTGSVTFTVSDEGATTANISRGSDNKLARLRFVGCPVNVTINSPNGDLSFYDINSTGESGQSTSRVKVTRSEPAAPGLMDFAVFSGGDIQ